MPTRRPKPTLRPAMLARAAKTERHPRPVSASLLVSVALPTSASDCSSMPPPRSDEPGTCPG